MKDEKIEFDLLTNGLDFVLASIYSTVEAEKDISKIKYAILHLSAGVELILKHRLSLEHWSLIFEDISKAKRANLNTGDFMSVNYNTCLNRLQNICSVELISKDLSIIASLRRQRNKIEHFAFKENVEALKSSLSKVLSIVINFIDEEFERSEFSEVNNEYYKEIRVKSSEFAKFVRLRLSQLKEQLESQLWLGRCDHCLQQTVCIDEASSRLICLFCNQIDSSKIITCPECLMNSLILDGWNATVYCLKCKYTEDPEKIAMNYIEKIDGHSFHIACVDGDDSVKTLCFECGSDSLIKKDDEYICLCCQGNWSTENVRGCDSCGELYCNNEELDYSMNCCDACIQFRVSKND